MNRDALLFLGFMAGAASIPVLVLLLRLVHVRVDERETVLITRFGRLVSTLTRPGWHFVADRVLPWVEVRRMSVGREYRSLPTVAINDASGTGVLVDIFLEFRVVDAVKATFAVADWERAMTNLVSHTVISRLANRDFREILVERTALAEEVRTETAIETERWGIHIERLLVRNVSLTPDVQQQLVRSVAAEVERWKADIEEDGRQRVVRLDAETSVKIARLVAEARAAYPAAIGKAFAAIKSNPRVCSAYEQLYELSLLHPHRTVAFVGFTQGELRAADAAMLTAPSPAELAVPPPGQTASS